MKVPLTRFRLNGHTTGFHSQTWKLESPLVSVSLTDSGSERDLNMTLLGVQADNGTYLVGGHMGRNQEVNVAGTKIIYNHKRSRTRDKITIEFPTDSFLRVMVSCFVHSFIHSFIPSFLPSFIHSFIFHSFFIHSFIHSFFIHSFV